MEVTHETRSRQDNKIGVLNIKGLKVTYNKKKDINVGISPYNVEISPKGNIALVANSGVTGGNDGNADTVSVIDLTASRPHVINAVGVGDIEVGAMPEGAVFSPDGKYIYVGNFLSDDISILKVEGRKVVDTGKRLKLPGSPAAMRGPK
jgi:YVTN family beta-propeller protein